jgi:hypothetical protein
MSDADLTEATDPLMDLVDGHETADKRGKAIQVMAGTVWPSPPPKSGGRYEFSVESLVTVRLAGFEPAAFGSATQRSIP